VTNQAWETLSNQAVGACGVVYFLALLTALAEWALGVGARSRGELAKTPVGAAAGPGLVDGADVVPTAPSSSDSSSDRVRMLGRLTLLLTIIAVSVHFVALLGRGMAADPHRVPWGNMYEFTLTGTFVVAAFYLVAYARFKLAWMAPFVLLFVVTVLMVAVLWLYEPVSPLTEALNSYWLVIHVVSAVISTGAFTLGGLTSLFLLLKSRWPSAAWLQRVPGPLDLDRIAYRMHAFGFPVWTFAVLITGPIWAHEAWSSYWNWDPKEVWAFITWVVYAAYLHARSTAGWKGRNAAILALVGLATLWFNFIGINYFSSTSQHSYAAPVVEVSSHASR
jgi:cytochrome c-type biogenesis protein CcsB